MSENYSEDKREENKPDEEVSTSQDPHQTDPSEDDKAFDRYSEAHLRDNFILDYGMQPCVMSVSSSAEIPKLTVVFDLDSTLIYSTKHKLLPAQSRFPSLEVNMHNLFSKMTKTLNSKLYPNNPSKQKEEQDFKKIKELVTQKSSLVPYDPKLPLVFTSEASRETRELCYSNVFLTEQKNRLLWHQGRYQEQKKMYAQIEKEALALLLRVHKFHQYTIFVGDRLPSVGTNISQKTRLSKIINSRLMRWTLKGKENYCADALSRLLMQTEKLYTVENREIKRITMTKKGNNSKLREVKKCIGDNWLEKIGREFKQFYQAREEIAEENELLLKARKIIIPESLRRKIMKVLHEGHPGIA
ncbi:hypothetical protein T12_15158 [Trichinella patagoniensis]|uniref:Reverse transcriptase/retrotransposon-derived protein RNase H-like domain-containing protein n=1 Tax=Trichinella patagoniensis TaxID=990121 RepID=A0A0V0ZS62_9BILA|nr:hypothetical protein T12_15158 [Trichinella patagoniensis]